MCCFVYLQADRLFDHRGRLYFSGLSSGLQPLPSERAGPELQSSRRLRSEAAVCSTEGSRLETGNSQVWKFLLQPHTVSVRLCIWIVDGSVLGDLLHFLHLQFLSSVQEKRQHSVKPRVKSEARKTRRRELAQTLKLHLFYRLVKCLCKMCLSDFLASGFAVFAKVHDFELKMVLTWIFINTGVITF